MLFQSESDIEIVIKMVKYPQAERAKWVWEKFHILIRDTIVYHTKQNPYTKTKDLFHRIKIDVTVMFTVRMHLLSERLNNESLWEELESKYYSALVSDIMEVKESYGVFIKNNDY